MKSRTKTILTLGCITGVVSTIIATYFCVVLLSKPKSISIASYDGVASFELDTTDDNITSVEKYYVYDIERARIYCKDEEKFFDDIKNDSRYVRTFEYVSESGNPQYKMHLMLSDQYYFYVEQEENFECARIYGVYQFDSPYEIYPFFNDALYIDIYWEGDTLCGGTEVFTVDKFNSEYHNHMVENAYETYEDLKEYYLHINPELYEIDDESKEIRLKVYSMTEVDYQTGSHYYEGYPVSIRFLDDGNIRMSYDLELLHGD